MMTDAAKQEWTNKLYKMSDSELHEACKHYIWLSAYANNNPRSDYHWMCDATYDECKSRGKTAIYTNAHAEISKR